MPTVSRRAESLLSSHCATQDVAVLLAHDAISIRGTAKRRKLDPWIVLFPLIVCSASPDVSALNIFHILLSYFRTVVGASLNTRTPLIIFSSRFLFLQDVFEHYRIKILDPIWLILVDQNFMCPSLPSNHNSASRSSSFWHPHKSRYGAVHAIGLGISPQS